MRAPTSGVKVMIGRMAWSRLDSFWVEQGGTFLVEQEAVRPKSMTAMTAAAPRASQPA